MREMGNVQKSVLAALKKHGSWHICCGWVWDTPSNTERILRTLMRRGHVEVHEAGAKFGGSTYPLYKPTPSGDS